MTTQTLGKIASIIARQQMRQEGVEKSGVPMTFAEQTMRDDIKYLLSLLATPVQEEEESVLDAAFHRGVDAAKEAIRIESSRDRGRMDGNCCYCAARFITAIARKCGRDTALTPDWATRDRLALATAQAVWRLLEEGSLASVHVTSASIELQAAIEQARKRSDG